MMILRNEILEAMLDERFPRLVRMARLDSASALAGCPPEQPFRIELNGIPYEETDLDCRLAAGADDAGYASCADYALEIPTLDLTLHFRFALYGDEIQFSLPGVEERGTFRLETLYIPEHRLVSGLAGEGASYLRYGLWRTNWSLNWLPGCDTGDYAWEHFGRVGDAFAELGALPTRYACAWNEGLCAVLHTSIHFEPLVTHMDSFAAAYPGRAGRFSIWAGRYFYRLRGELAEPLLVRLAFLGDYDGDGKIDWTDAANWQGDQLMPGSDPYAETILYKIHIDSLKLSKPNCTFKQCLDLIKQIHQISGGMKQIAYLVGWQHTGHDSGFPNPQYVNSRAGGREDLLELIEAAQDYGCTVSLHANLNDTYENEPGYDPEIIARAPDGKPYLWFYNSIVEQACYCVNLTRLVETGLGQQWIDELLSLVPIRETIHLDAHRGCSESWLANGEYIPAESEIQRGLYSIARIFQQRGIDVTCEGGDPALHRWTWLLPDWWQHYPTVMLRGRTGGFYRITAGFHRSTDPVGDGLGNGFVCEENAQDDYLTLVRRFYSLWMYDQILRRKRLTGYAVGDWLQSVKAHYSGETWLQTWSDPASLTAVYEEIPIARGADRFLPWREDLIFAHNPGGGLQEWTLPAAWEGKGIRAEVLREDGDFQALPFQVMGRSLCFEAPAGLACRFSVVSP